MPKDKIQNRIDSTKEYIDKLQDSYSKLNVVRIDLSYKKPYSENITLDDANSHLNNMMNNRRSKPSIFKNQIGYVCKKEYTKDKGVHFHAMFFYDGQKIQKDEFKGEQIGEYWNQITKEKGIYFNCNRNKKKYEKLGIGMLDHADSEKRKNLNSTVSYLCKDDYQDITPIKSNEKDRSFVRGTVPKGKGKVGRPRK